MTKTLTPHPTPRLLPPFLPPVCDHHQTCKTAKSVILRKLFKFRNQSSADHVVKESKKPIAFRGKIAKLSFLRKTRLKLSCSSSNKEESRGDQGEKAQIMNSVVPASWM
jgi:hypothetical protein